MKALEAIKTWWIEAPSVARALAVTGVASVLLISLWFGSTDPSHHWVPLREEPMSFAEAGRLSETLESMNVPFRTEAEGRGQTVLVPIERADELRMALARDGVAFSDEGSPYDTMFQDGGPTFTTARMERAMHSHAKEKSIERKLMSLRPVKRAMVDLALPENSILKHNEHQATASVVVELEPRYGFSKELAASIRDTVAHAVEGLTPDKVAVTDHLGRRIGPSIGDAATALASRTLALRQEQESHFEARIVELLEPIVGRGRVVARVSAQMDMSRSEQRSEEFDPDNTVVRRERKSSDTASSEERVPPLAAGVGGNAPQRPAGGDDAPASRTNNDNTITETDYAVPKKIVETSRPMGQVQRLSVAVVVDSVGSTEPAPAGEDGKTLEVPVDVEIKEQRGAPMPSERALAELVKKAVGFDPVRGDQIEILYAPFSRPKFADATFAASAQERSTLSSIPPWVPFSVVIAVGFLLVGGGMIATERRRRQRILESEEKAAEEKARLEAERLEQEQAAADKIGQLPIKDEMRRLAQSNLNATTQVVKDWLATTGA